MRLTAAEAVGRLIELVRSPSLPNTLLAEAWAKPTLAEFLLHARPVVASGEADGGDGGGADGGGRGDRAVNHAVVFLNEHYAEAEALQQMYERVDLSVSYFRKLFQRQMGCSPQAHLTRRRMEAARYALHTSSRSIKQIAGDVGYDDPLYFSRVYARHWGHPPSHDHHRRWPADGPPGS